MATRSATPIDPPYFTVRELAAAFGAHPHTIRRWARTGLIPSVKAGPRNHKIWFLERDVRVFLKSKAAMRAVVKVLFA